MRAVKPGVHFGVWLVLCWIILGWPPEFRAQNRVIARVELNKGRVNKRGEVYDPTRASGFALTGAMNSARRAHTATKLLDGKVLIAAGHDGSNYLQTAEIFDPATATFAETTMVDASTNKVVPSYVNAPRAAHTATLLSNGMVVLVGGLSQKFLDSAELYNPSTGKFTATAGALGIARAYHTATLLASGVVLITGGFDGTDYLDTAELYDPSTRTFRLLSRKLNAPRAYHSATLMANGEVLIAGGYNADGYPATAVIYDPANETFRITAALTGPRASHAAALLKDGTILIAGGTNGKPLETAEIFNPATNSFTATAGAMTAAREGHTATALPNGGVLIAGGSSGSQLKSAEIYNSSSRTFTALPYTMDAARQSHTATLLDNGTVLLAGGQNSKMLVFDVNSDSTDNVAPNILFSSDAKQGWVACTGSGAVIVFSPETGEVLKTIETGGKPTFMTPLADGHTVAVVSAWEAKIFLIDMNSQTLAATLSFPAAEFAFGSMVAVSHDGSKGYISSTGTGEVIKFSLPAGQELGRLKDLRTPGQLALTPDDSTLLVVDTTTAEIIFVNTATMAKKAVLDAKDTDSFAAFSIFNDVVLSANGAQGIIASRNQNEDGLYYSVFVFDTAKAEILTTLPNGEQPGRTALTPDGENWVILNRGSLMVVPTANPASYRQFYGESEPLLSANLVFSPDSRYAYYAAASSDYFLQQELTSTAIVGKLLMGDDPDEVQDQPSSVAITPDGKMLAVLDFASNNIELLTSSTVLSGIKFISNTTQITGVTLVNVSDREIHVRMTAETEYGTTIEGTDIVNPIKFVMAPNSQLSMAVDQLFHFDLETEQTGWLLVECDQPGIAGYLAIVKIKADWLGAYVNQMDGVPLITGKYHDWIVPHVSRETGDIVELNFLSTNYSPSSFTASRRTADGSEIENRTSSSGAGQIRYSQIFDTVYTQSLVDQVLIVGGSDSKSALASAETADANGSVFSSTAGAPNRAYTSHTATVLSSGKVLILGGKDAADIIQNTAAIYDPASGTFSATASAMLEYRYRCAATLLANGKVLVSGGQSRFSTSNTAELYDPITDAFLITVEHMTSPRDAHTATLLPDGKVLIAGGASGDRVLDTAEIYDPRIGTFTATGNMMVPRSFHTATLLENGKVLITGGYNGSYLNSAEVYDPATGRFSSTLGTMTRARSYHTATLLADGRTLIVGGTDGANTTDTAEMYDPALNSFTTTIGVMNTKRQRHTATFLSNEKVLVLGGTDGSSALQSAEIFDPEVDSFAASAGAMTTTRYQHTATLLAGGTDAYIRATSTEGFSFAEFYGNADHQAALGGIDVDQFASIATLYSPHFALVFGFRSILNVINANANPAEITIKLHGADGALLCAPETRFLTAGGQLKQDLDAIFGYDVLLKNASGWLEIMTSVDFVVGSITFTNADGDFESSFQLQGSPMIDFVFPLTAQDYTFMTAFALLNAGDLNADIVLELWAPDGSLERTARLSLPAGTRTARYLSEYFPNLGDRLLSNVRIHSSAPVFALGLMHDKDLRFMSALPAIPYPEIK